MPVSNHFFRLGVILWRQPYRCAHQIMENAARGMSLAVEEEEHLCLVGKSFGEVRIALNALDYGVFDISRQRHRPLHPSPYGSPAAKLISCAPSQRVSRPSSGRCSRPEVIVMK